MENEKRLIEKCYEEVEKYLNGEYHKEKRIDSYKFPFNKISRIMNILATLRLSKYRDKITRSLDSEDRWKWFWNDTKMCKFIKFIFV